MSAGLVLLAAMLLLPLVSDCQLTSADEVDRRSTIGRGSGGSGGTDGLPQQTPDAPGTDEALPDAMSPPDRSGAILDLGDSETRGTIDGTSAPIDSQQTNETGSTCSEESSDLCDDLESDARSNV